jgi:sulfur carrier protein
MLTITVNGQPKRYAPATSVEAIIADMQLTTKRFAVECNGEIIQKSRLSTTVIAEGDRFEIVVAVGGG